MMEKAISMEIVNSNAAGIDIGSRSHWVAVGQGVGDLSNRTAPYILSSQAQISSDYLEYGCKKHPLCKS